MIFHLTLPKYIKPKHIRIHCSGFSNLPGVIVRSQIIGFIANWNRKACKHLSPLYVHEHVSDNIRKTKLRLQTALYLKFLVLMSDRERL